MAYIKGKTIKELRERQGITQKELAERLNISDKTVSKWETDRGLPDICIVDELARALGVSLAELFAGEFTKNSNTAGNMKKMNFYICPVCGNIISAVGKGSFSCCGITLPSSEGESEDEHHQIDISVIDDEYYITCAHPMTKSHYISFVAYVTGGNAEIVKLYPEQDISVRLRKKGHGIIYMYCNRHGLFKKII